MKGWFLKSEGIFEIKTLVMNNIFELGFKVGDMDSS